MSASQTRGLATLGIDAASLAAVFGVAYAGMLMIPGVHTDGVFVASIGFLLLAGTLTSRLIEVVGVPHLTGYLLAGTV